jgi:hypothetical protein
MSFIDFAEVKARCSIEQAAKLLDLKTTEECSQLRAPCPVCSGGPRASSSLLRKTSSTASRPRQVETKSHGSAT